MTERKEILDIAIKSLKFNHAYLINRIESLEKQREEALELYRWILLGDPQKIIYEYHFFMQGILNRTINLLESFIIDLALQNIYSTTMILRAHYETLASLNYYLKYPDKRDQLLWGEKYKNKKNNVNVVGIHIMDMLRKLDEDTPSGIKVIEDYEEMSQIIHPNRKSNLAGVKEGVKDNDKTPLNFSSHTEMDSVETKTAINAHINLVSFILNSAKDFDNSFCKAKNIQKIMPILKERNETTN